MGASLCRSARSRIVVGNYYYCPLSKWESAPYSITAPSANGTGSSDTPLSLCLSVATSWRPRADRTSEWPLGDLGRCTAAAVRQASSSPSRVPAAACWLIYLFSLLSNTLVPAKCISSRILCPLFVLFPEFDFSWSCPSGAPGP